MYLIVIALSPQFLGKGNWNKTENYPIKNGYIYIPKISQKVTYSTGNETALDRGLWYRNPLNGSPASGGNFVLAGHRYTFDWVPAWSIRKSPLYHIERLQPGDEIFADYKNKRYKYTVEKIYDVKPTDIHIEKRTDQPTLTLYSCTRYGEADGRVVVRGDLVSSTASPTFNF